MANTSTKSYRQTARMLERRKELADLFTQYRHTFAGRAYERDQDGRWVVVNIGENNPLLRRITTQKITKIFAEQAADFFKLQIARGDMLDIAGIVSGRCVVFVVPSFTEMRRITSRVRSSFPIDKTKTNYSLPGIWIDGVRLGPVRDNAAQNEALEWLFITEEAYNRMVGSLDSPFLNKNGFSKIPDDFHYGCKDFIQEQEEEGTETP